MEPRDRGQVNTQAAEVYEEFFLPALFAPWTDRVADAARLRPGQRVLDVACGTGVLTRRAAAIVGSEGSVVGLDPNEGMLAVAARASSDIDWVRGVAEALPFEDASFDAVVSQFGMMFFDDPVVAVREGLRVLRKGGRLVVAVWDALENTPGYAAMTDLLARLFGPEVANGLRAPFAMGDEDELRSLFERGGAEDVEVTTQEGWARFPSIAAWIHTDVRGWTLSDRVDDEQYRLLCERAEVELRRFVTDDGEVVFRVPAHIVTVAKAERGAA